MNEPRRLVEVGTFPAGYATTFADGADPVARLVAEAAAKLDAEAAEAEWARLAWLFRRAVKALTRIK
jgi:hypothetical protein